jgi:DNA-binding transcriptional LysR family regulator
VLRDPWLLLIAAGSRLATRRPPPKLEDLADEPLIGFHPSRTAELLEESMRARGLTPRIVFRSDDNATVQGLVATGFGSALLPALAVDMADPRIVRLPADLPPRSIVIAWHADRVRSPAAEAFVALAGEVCAAIQLD